MPLMCMSVKLECTEKKMKKKFLNLLVFSNKETETSKNVQTDWHQPEELSQKMTKTLFKLMISTVENYK